MDSRNDLAAGDASSGLACVLALVLIKLGLEIGGSFLHLWQCTHGRFEFQAATSTGCDTRNLADMLHDADGALWHERVLHSADILAALKNSTSSTSVLRRFGSVGIDPPFDFRNTFLMVEDQFERSKNATDNDCGDRYQ